ncbi:MAG: DUF3857 domain-containing protein [Bacteroidota bacterium]
MKKIIFYFFLLSGLLYFSSPLMAQDENSDAVYLSLIKEYTLNPDGSMDYRLIKMQKLFTYRSFHNLYGETFIVYKPDFQKLKVNEVYTLMADGKKISSPENAFNEVLPGFAANAPAYNSLREMVITHTGLECNATIFLDYQIHSEKGSFPALMGNELLSENEPIKNLKIIVRIPLGSNLFYQAYNTPDQPVISISGSFQVFTWAMDNVPAISAEENQPGGFELYPRLMFSTAEYRDQVCSFLTDQPAFTYEMPEFLKSDVNQLKGKTPNTTDFILKLQERIVNDLRLYPIPLRIAAYRCRTPVQIWKSNGGTPVEKAVLFTSLLKEAGIEAWPVGIIRKSCTNEKAGTLLDIEDFAVKIVDKESGNQILSVTNMNPLNLKMSLPGRTFIDFKPAKENSYTHSDAIKSKVEVSGTFIVSSDPRLTGEMNIYLEGTAYPLNGFMRDKNKIRDSFSGSLKSGDLKDFSKSNSNEKSVYQSFTVQSDHPFRKDSNFYYFTLPSVKTGIDGWGIKTLSGRRETPYEIPSESEEKYTFSFTLATDLTLFTPVRKVSINNKSGSFLWEITNEKGKIQLTRKINFSGQIFQISDYPDFKCLLDYWNNPRYRELIFVMGK